MTKTTAVEHMPKIELKEWGLPVFDKIENMVVKEMGEALNEAMEQRPPCISLPFLYGDSDGRGGPAVDPLTIYVELPAFFEDEPPTWTVSFKDAAMEIVDDYMSPSTGRVEDEPGRAILAALTKALRDLADELDGCVGE